MEQFRWVVFQSIRWVAMSSAILSSFWFSSTALAQGPAAPGTAETKTSLGFFEIVFSGGWSGVLIMLTLIGLSMLAAFFIFDQIMVLRRNEVIPPTLAEEVRQYLAQGRVADADEACRRNPSPLSFVIVNGLAELDFGWQSMEKAMEDAVSEQAAKMYRKIEYLSVIGNLAPMLGLLGTVTGMILAFQQVAVSQGSAGAAALAEGIYSALVTTVAGLVIAIPSLAAFAIFRNRIDQMIAEIAFMAQHVFTPVRRRVTQVSRPAGVPPTNPPRSKP
jgi:biopolymer transport protein ExbB